MRRIAAMTAALAVGLVGSLVGGAVAPAAAAESQTVIESTDFTWSYLDDGTDPAAGADSPDAWAAPEFDDAAWPTATGPFGAVRGELAELSGGFMPATLLSQYQSGSTTNVPAFFFRSTLTLTEADLAAAQSITADLRYDDAVSLFVNGVYVGGGHDDELQASAQRNTEFGGSNMSAPLLERVEIPTEVLTAGDNVLALRLHNGRASSSDIYVDLERLTISTELTWEQQLRESSISNVILGVGATEDSRNLVWYTDDAHSTAPVVELVEASQLQDGEFPATGATVFTAELIDTERALQGNSRGFEANVNKVVFEGLAPDTAYAYRIGDGDQWLGQWTFTTETGGDEWSFFFTGDPQIGAASGHRGANPMERSWVADSWGWNDTMEVATATYPEIRTHVSAGDQVESSRPAVLDSAQNRTEVEYLGYSYPEALKTLQNAPTLGNHDYYTGGRETYQQHYHLANFDGETWNNWWGQGNVLFLHLNTEFHYPAGIDYPSAFDIHDAWMTQVLEEQGDKYQHHVVVMHRPLYSVGPHSVSGTTTNVRDTFVPLLNKHGIDALLTGHDHTYTRSHIVDGFHPGTYTGLSWEGGSGEIIDLGTGADAPDEVFLTGTQMVSIVANSASGSKYYDIQDAAHPHTAVQNQDFMRSYTVVDVDSCSLTYRTHRAEAHGDLALNSIVDEVRVNVASAAPTLEAPAGLTVLQSEAAGLDLLDGVEYTVCDAEKFPVEITGENDDAGDRAAVIDPELLDQPQTVTYTIAAGTAWEVSVEREVTVVADPTETPIETPIETPDETDDPIETDVPGETPGETGTPGETPGETGTPGDAQTPGSAQDDPAEAGTAPVGAKPTDGGLASTGAELPMPVLVAGVAALLAGALLLRRRAQAGEDQ